ncbi:hypothetical protein ACFVRB_41880 [Streptomyces nojiriensis]|uniref:hypothetical protein n=1 Tax=Streptomyces nojiriensis TaxID=66374 RepID=UPI0036DB799E
MPGRIELIDWADQAATEPGFGLDGLADLQEPVEALEDLHVLAPGRGGSPGKGQVADNTVNVFGSDVPCGPAQRGERPFQQSPMSFSTVTGLNPRARHEATNASTQSA